MLKLDLNHFKELVKQRVGLTFDNTREDILRRNIAELLRRKVYSSRAELFNDLLHDEAVFADFVDGLTINETYFFREPRYLRLLADHLAPDLLGARQNGEKIKIVSAGCSTGEEPYSIAMTLLDKYGSSVGSRFSLFGIDIDSSALGRARAGLFGKLSFRNEESLAQKQYFEQKAAGLFQIKPEVGKLVNFARVNLLDPVYPEVARGADIIFYRNVSIYFDAATQRKIFRSLAASLNETGYVVFSSSETFSHRDNDCLDLVETAGLFYFRKNSATGSETAGLRQIVNREDTAKAPRGRVAKGPPGDIAKSGTRRAPLAPASPGLPGKAGEHGGRGEDPAALFQAAMDCFTRKEHAPALVLLERLLRHEDFQAKACILKSCILLNARKFAEAEDLLHKALLIDELDLDAHMLLGLIARNTGAYSKAAHCFQKALYVEHSCWMAHYFLAEIHREKGESAKAGRAYDSVLRILENGDGDGRRLKFFPISFQRRDLIHLCRQKIAAIQEGSHGV
jgi:chemotaxis protein methyltransferase CheR